MTRRLDAPRRGLDMRIVAIVGFVAIGLVAVLVAFVVSAGPNPWAGTPEPDMGGGHVNDGTDVRLSDSSAYASTPATSGPHWSTPAQWGVYSAPQPESQLVHNLEHGGIVVWYQPDQVDAAGVEALANYVDSQVRSGLGGRFKFILTPWAGEDFGSPIAVTAWRRLLYLDEPNVDAVRGFGDANYGRAPENGGGPGPPA